MFNVSTWPFPAQLIFLIVMICFAVYFVIWVIDQILDQLWLRKQARERVLKAEHDSVIAKAVADGFMTVNEGRLAMQHDNLMKFRAEQAFGHIVQEPAAITLTPMDPPLGPDILRGQCGRRLPHTSHCWQAGDWGTRGALLIFCEGRDRD